MGLERKETIESASACFFLQKASTESSVSLHTESRGSDKKQQKGEKLHHGVYVKVL